MRAVFEEKDGMTQKRLIVASVVGRNVAATYDLRESLRVHLTLTNVGPDHLEFELWLVDRSVPDEKPSAPHTPIKLTRRELSHECSAACGEHNFIACRELPSTARNARV
jgi:hypothetical protein